MKNVKIVLVVLVVGLFAMPATSFGVLMAHWEGDSTTGSWSDSANWSNGVVPTATHLTRIGDGYPETGAKSPIVNSAGCVAGDLYVGHTGDYTFWRGPGELTISSGSLGASHIYVGTDGYNGMVTQTGGVVNITSGGTTGYLKLGDGDEFGSYTISGGSLNIGHTMFLGGMTAGDGGSALFHVDGSGATSISTGWDLYAYRGTDEMRFTMDAAGITPIITPKMTLHADGTHTLTVDASGYTGPEADIVLIDYSGTGNLVGTYDSVNLSGGATSIAYGTVIGGAVTVHVVPEPATMLLLGLGGLVLRRRRA